MKSDAELREILETLEAIDYRRTFRRFDFFTPYPKQRRFLELGASKRERLLMAANRVGKTETGAFEMACHLTGQYPPWWKGKRFEREITAWVCGLTTQAVRDVCQEKLCGKAGVEEAWGTGMVPKDALIDKSLARGIPNAIDTIQVRHKSGGISTATFKSVEQGREKFQGVGLDVMWFDEEPPLNIYSEGLTRIGERGGICYLTFTPLLGPSSVVLRFTDEPSPARDTVAMELEDVPDGGHLTAAQKQEMIDGYLPHEREARAKGIPMLGEGRIFTTAEEQIIEPAIQFVPQFWRKLWGIDFGIGHPFAAVLLLWEDPDGVDVIHVHATYRIADALSIVHAAAMKRIAGMVPVAWPRDGTDRDVHSGEPLSVGYKKHGLVMLPEHATWPDGGVSTDAGIAEWDERERTGRLKVAAQLSDWFEERRMYHRKDGKIMKIKDDLMSATRIGLMMKRFARQVPLGLDGSKADYSDSRGFARGTAGHPDGDFDLFSGAA